MPAGRSLWAWPPAAAERALQECCQVPGDGRVADIGQSHLVQAGAGAALRLGVARHGREEAFENDPAHFRRRQRGMQGAADHLPAAAHDGDREGAGGAGPSSVSLACRQACVSMPYWAASSRPAAGSLVSTNLASARSMLSPPSSR